MLRTIYRCAFRRWFQHQDPEAIHEGVMKRLPWVRPLGPLLHALFSVQDERLRQQIWGIDFPNPIGLAGGFDKNAVAADCWPLLGFGFCEVGTVTPQAQVGNPQPRLFRYPEQEALVNRMGFNNDGAEALALRLEQQTRRGVTGISLGKQKETPVDDLDAVIEDYRASLKRLYVYGDFFVVNVSSPNTAKLRDLQRAERVQPLLQALLEEMDQHSDGGAKPLLVKFAPDLDDDTIRELVDRVQEAGVSGVIATNTTNQTQGLENGGLSGRPLRQRSTAVIRLIAEHTRGGLPIIGCGGIFDPADAIEKLEAGAWLLQLYTGFVYRGPTVARDLGKGILHEMEQNNYQSLREFRRAIHSE